MYLLRTRIDIIFVLLICREKVVVGVNKTNVIFRGNGYENTMISWNDTANSTGGTTHSFSVAVFATDFTAYNISFVVTDH